jgi:purine-binding chemotaxis protein CheW
MSEQERMERAKRIRRMREGNRADDQDDEADGQDDEGDAVEETAATNGSGGTAVAESGDEASESEGTRAPVPSAEEMQELQDEAGVQAVDATPEDETTDAEAVEAPDAETPEEPEATAEGAAIADEDTKATEPETRVLEFTLADEQYCLDIEYIEEIVKQDVVTRVPNTPEFIEGVVDLRGQITTILNPKMAIGKDDAAAGDLIVVFDPDNFDEQGNIGWVVDDVRQVSPVAESQINEPPMQEEYIQGVIDREDDEEFVIWTTPDLALDEAA